MFWLAATAAAALLMSAARLVGASPAAPHECHPPRGSIVASSRVAVVFRGRPSGRIRRRLTFACLWDDERTLLLDVEAWPGSVDPRTVRLRGVYVAYGDDGVRIETDYEEAVVP